MNLMPSVMYVIQRNPQVPEEYWASYPQAPIPEACPRNRTRFQDRSAFPEPRGFGVARGGWSLPRWAVWRYQSLRHSCQACYNNAERYSTCQKNPWWKSLTRISRLEELCGGSINVFVFIFLFFFFTLQLQSMCKLCFDNKHNPSYTFKDIVICVNYDPQRNSNRVLRWHI